MWRRKAIIVASSTLLSTVERGFDGPVFLSSRQVRFFHSGENIAPSNDGTEYLEITNPNMQGFLIESSAILKQN